jgi:hypothetical protein
MMKRTVRLTRAQMCVFLRDPLLVEGMRECGASATELCPLSFDEFADLCGAAGAGRVEYEGMEVARIARLRAVMGAAAGIERGRNAVAVAARHALVRSAREPSCNVLLLVHSLFSPCFNVVHRMLVGGDKC